MSARNGRRASNIGSSVDPSKRQALAARQRRQSMQLLRRMSQGQYAEPEHGSKRPEEASKCLVLRATREGEDNSEQETMDLVREQRLAREDKEYNRIVEGDTSSLAFGAHYATSTMCLEAALRMLHGVPTLSPDMADIVVHRGVDEHELRMGSEPGARFRDWAGAGAAIARVERYQHDLEVVITLEDHIRQLPIGDRQPCFVEVLERMQEESAVSGGAVTFERAEDASARPRSPPKTSRQRRASLQSPTTARDLSRSPSPRQRRAPLQDTADGMRMLQLRRAESPPLTARSRREEAGMRESAVRVAAIVLKGRDAICLVLKPGLGQVVCFDPSPRHGEYTHAAFLEFRSLIKAQEYVSRVFAFKRGADKSQTRDFNHVQSLIVVLRGRPRPHAFGVSKAELEQFAGDSEQLAESELERIKTKSWWFMQQLVNPSLRAGLQTTSEAASRSSLVIALVQAFWRADWVRNHFIFTPMPVQSVASDSVYVALKMLLQRYARSADERAPSEIPLHDELTTLLASLSNYSSREPAQMLHFMLRAMHSELAGSETMENEEARCGPNHSLTAHDTAVGAWAGPQDTERDMRIQRRKYHDLCPGHAGFALDLEERWTCTRCHATTTAAQLMAPPHSHYLTFAHTLHAYSMKRASEDLAVAGERISMETVLRHAMDVGWRRPCPAAPACGHCGKAAAKTVCHTCPALSGSDHPEGDLIRPLCSECYIVVHSVDAQVLDIEGDEDLDVGDDDLDRCDACGDTARGKRIDMYSTPGPVKTQEVQRGAAGSERLMTVVKELTICSRCHDLDIMPPLTQRHMFRRVRVGKTYRKLLHAKLVHDQRRQLDALRKKQKEELAILQEEISLLEQVHSSASSTELTRLEHQMRRLEQDHEGEMDALRKRLEKAASREERERFSMQSNPKAPSREHYCKAYPTIAQRAGKVCGGPALVSTRLRRAPPVFAVSVLWGERPPSQADMRPLLQLMAQVSLDLSRVYHQVRQARYRLVAIVCRQMPTTSTGLAVHETIDTLSLQRPPLVTPGRLSRMSGESPKSTHRTKTARSTFMLRRSGSGGQRSVRFGGSATPSESRKSDDGENKSDDDDSEEEEDHEEEEESDVDEDADGLSTARRRPEALRTPRPVTPRYSRTPRGPSRNAAVSAIGGGVVRSSVKHVVFECIVRSRVTGEWALLTEDAGISRYSWPMVEAHCLRNGSAPVTLIYERCDVGTSTAHHQFNPFLTSTLDEAEDDERASVGFDGDDAQSAAGSHVTSASSAHQSEATKRALREAVAAAADLDNYQLPGSVSRAELEGILGITGSMEVEAERSVAAKARTAKDAEGSNEDPPTTFVPTALAQQTAQRRQAQVAARQSKMGGGGGGGGGGGQDGEGCVLV